MKILSNSFVLGLEKEDIRSKTLLNYDITDIVYAIDELETSQEEMDEYIQTLDEDIADIQGHIYGEYDEDVDRHVPNYIEVVCPHCDETVYFDEDMFQEEDDITCPNCDEPIYTECPEDDEDDEED